MPCDPNVLWMEHKIRWIDSATKGLGWYKMKETDSGPRGKRVFYAKLTRAGCPLCGHPFHDQRDASGKSCADQHHPRPDAWLREMKDTKGGVRALRAAGDAAALLSGETDSEDAGDPSRSVGMGLGMSMFGGRGIS